MTVVRIDLPPADYETSTAGIQPDESACFRLHRFTFIEPVAPGS
ncbi:hypothetical protein [Streptomyces sp. NPDC057909]